MLTADFLQLIVVALIAGFVGYRLGQASVTRVASGNDSAPLPGPAATPEPRFERGSTAAPPPASAGGGTPSAGTRTPPRRSSAPPPAAAGLMSRGDDK